MKGKMTLEQYEKEEKARKLWERIKELSVIKLTTGDMMREQNNIVRELATLGYKLRDTMDSRTRIKTVKLLWLDEGHPPFEVDEFKYK